MTHDLIHTHLAALAKPPGSLGRLEELAAQLCFIQQTLAPRTNPRRVVLFAADHGVVNEGVSAWPSEVTRLMVQTIANGRAASSVLAASTGTELQLVDVGTIGPPTPAGPILQNCLVRASSRNLAHEPALTIDEFRAAWAIGEAQATKAIDGGIVVVAAGEMGIGNTTPASCLIALLTDHPAEAVVGPGAGSNQDVIARKLEVVRTAVQKARQHIDHEPEYAMASVCGLEIAAMAGFYHTAARAGLTIVLDGVIATTAALIAERLHPGTSQSMIAAHRSAEPGHGFSLEQLGLVPILENWEMRLGEGTGAILLMPLLDAAAAITRMATLQDVLASAS